MIEGETVSKYYDACIAADFEAKIARLENRIKDLDNEKIDSWRRGYEYGYEDGSVFGVSNNGDSL